MSISLRQLEIFTAVADTLSFSEAARLCHLSQPGLSAAIHRLESDLDARLFDRSTRRVALTPVGEELLRHSSQLLNGARRTAQHIRQFVEGRHGRLTVAASPSLSALIVPRAIAVMAQRAPDVLIQLNDRVSSICLAQLRSGEADVALIPAEAPAADLHQQPLFNERLVAVLPTRAAAGLPARLRWKDLRHLPQIVLGSQTALREGMADVFRRRGWTLQIRYEVDRLTTAVGMAREQLGVVVLPASLVSVVDLHGVVRREIAERDGQRMLCAITLADRTAHPAVRLFVRELLAAVDSAAVHAA